VAASLGACRCAGEEKRERGREREGVVALLDGSRGFSLSWNGKQEVAALGPAQDTQELAVPATKTKTILQIAP
jgi:hypothetical protein